MKRHIRLLAIAGVALALSACSPRTIIEGYHIDDEKLAQLQPRVTSQEQVGQLLGSPSSVATFHQNSDTWYYISKELEAYTEFDRTVVSQQVVAIDFNESGHVENVRRYTLGDAKDVAFVSRETPTQGQELGFFEQLFGNIGGGRLAQQEE